MKRGHFYFAEKRTFLFGIDSDLLFCSLERLSLSCYFRTMAEEKPLTKSILLTTLKEAGFATKEDVKQIVKELVPSIVNEQIKSNSLATKEDVKQQIQASERRIIRRLGVVKRDLAQRIATVTIVSPTMIQFENHEKRITKLEQN